MVGWSIRIYRRSEGGDALSQHDTAERRCLASWRTGLHGADWIDDLVRRGRALALGGNGYPYHYAVAARWLAPHALAVRPDDRGPADPRSPWVDTRPFIDRDGLERCDPDEWLLVEVWDLD